MGLMWEKDSLIEKKAKEIIKNIINGINASSEDVNKEETSKIR